MTDIEQQPELKTEMNTATDPDAQPTWDANTDLSGLKGVTIPSTAPSFNEDPRRGRHWSPDNAIQADDDSLRSIFASLDAMPTLQHGSGTVPDPMPRAAAEQQPAAEPQQSAQRQPMQQSAAPQAVASQSVRNRSPLRHGLRKHRSLQNNRNSPTTPLFRKPRKTKPWISRICNSTMT